MRNACIALGAWHKACVYVALVAIYATGIAWIGLHYGINRDAALEAASRTAENWVLSAHGAAAMLMLIAIGSMLAVHVPGAWKKKRSRSSGSTMVASALSLAITGWLLYYASAESVRVLSSDVHLTLGCAVPLVVSWHLASRQRNTHRR